MPVLPSADRAVIPAEKLRDYVLDPDHGTGRHKARVFRSALGIERDDWEYLRDKITERLPSAEIESVSATSFGFRYSVPMILEGLNGQAHEVVTAWLLPSEDAVPRLVSAYVNIP